MKKTREIKTVIKAMLLLKEQEQEQEPHVCVTRDGKVYPVHWGYIEKVFIDYDGVARVFRGRVEDMGVTPYLFNVVYTDGDSETMTLSQLEDTKIIVGRRRCQSRRLIECH